MTKSNTKVFTDEQEKLLIDKSALLCGLARWRVAIYNKTIQTDDDLLRDFQPQSQSDLDQVYLCIDSDIARMYTYPGSSAGYLGWRYYGRASEVNDQEYASAAALTGELGRFILFELECKQDRDSRLLLPVHAEEIFRRYLRANELANLALDTAEKEWLILKQQANNLVGYPLKPGQI